MGLRGARFSRYVAVRGARDNTGTPHWDAAGRHRPTTHVPALPASRCLAANDSTNRRVLWFSIGEAVVLVGMGVLQVLYLKSFFERKRAF